MDRFTAPLYPVVFMFVALAALGQARTTRQGRGLAVASAILVIVAIRIAGFAAQALSAKSAMGAILAFALPVLVSFICAAILLNWIRWRGPRTLFGRANRTRPVAVHSHDA